MTQRIPQSTTKLVLFKAFLASDHTTEATGKTIAITISKNGGAFGNPNAGATNATGISSGWYSVSLDTTDTNTLGPLAIRGAEGTIDDVGILIEVVSATSGGYTNLDAAISSRMATYTQPTGFLAATFPSGTIANTTNITSITGNITGNLTGSVGSVTGAVGSVTGLTVSNLDATISSRMASYTQPTGFLAATFPGGTIANTTNITAGTITTVSGNVNGSVGSVTGAVGSVTGSVGSVTGAVGSVTGNVGGNVTGTIGGLAAAAATDVEDAVWDTVLASHLTAGSTGAALNGAASAGDPWLTALPGAYGAGTAGKIIGDNINATISSRMATYTQPTGFLAATFPSGTIANTTNITAGTVTTVSGNVNGSVGSVTGSVGSVTGAVGSVTGNVGGNVTGTIGGLAAGGTTAVENAVWNTVLASHLTAGSTGAALNAAGSAGDPWITALPGAYGAGTAGNIVGNNLNATITSRMASYTQPTGFLAATFPSGTIANTTNVTAGTITTVSGNVNGSVGSVTGAVGSVTGLTASNLDTTVSSRLSTAGYTAPDNASVTAIKAKTDSLSFTVANKVDSNIRNVNNVAVTGNGSVGTPWGP